MTQNLKKIHPRHITNAVAKIFGVKSKISDWDDFAHFMDSNLDTRLPFTFSELILISEIMPITGMTLHDKSKNFLKDLILQDVCNDTPNHYLIHDSFLTGTSAIYVVHSPESKQAAYDYISFMRNPKLSLGHLPDGDLILSAALTSFA